VAVRDSDDAVILSEALALRADVLVTGDRDLLEAGDAPGLRILDPRGFWSLVRGEAS
jgi:predicted nucleic acid-binding protein